MDRDFIVVTGNQGFGKSVWGKLYCKTKSRLFVSDPKAEYDADFLTDPAEWMESVISGKAKTFRYGTYLPDELQMFGQAAFASGNCVLVIEECALIFKRGEELHEWARPLVFMGREQRVSLVLVAQRLAKIPIDIRSQASRVISFRQTEPDDVRAVIDRFGEIGEEIPALPPLTCLDWNDGTVSRYTIRPG